MEMVKKIISRCLIFMACFNVLQVSAASTCDYSTQVELSNIASTVKADYEIKQVVIDINGNIREDKTIDDTAVDEELAISKVLKVHINNITNDIYVKVISDRIDRTYHFSETTNGEIVFDGGDLTSIVNYKVEVYSNKDACKDDLLRTINFVTPKENLYAGYSGCQAIPNFGYCQEYITTDFRVSDEEIQNQISSEYAKYLENEKKEEEKNATFLEKLENFFEKNKIVILSIITIVVVAGAFAIVVILKKRRSRIL